MLFGSLMQRWNTGEEKHSCSSVIISHGDAGLSDLGCRVQLALSEHCFCRRSRGGRGSSQSGTSCRLMDRHYPSDMEMAQMCPPYSRNLRTMVCHILLYPSVHLCFIVHLSKHACRCTGVFFNYLVGRCYKWIVQMKTERCQGYRWLARHFHAGTHGQAGTDVL